MEIKNSIMGLVRRASYVLTLHCTGRTLESPLDCKKINPVNPKGNQSWIFIGRTDAEAETPVLWPPIRNSWLTGKDPDAGKDWRQEKGMTEDEMVRWHQLLDDMSLSKLWELWWTGKPDMLQSMGLQRVGHDWATDWLTETQKKWRWEAKQVLAFYTLMSFFQYTENSNSFLHSFHSWAGSQSQCPW